jgi:hypothetical protein
MIRGPVLPRTAMKNAPGSDSELALEKAQDALLALQRREWWSWSTALFIILLLSFAVWITAAPSVRDLAIMGLIPLVLLFALFVIYQQRSIAQLRLELATQIGFSATLAALRPATTEEARAVNNRRRALRYYLDQRVKVTCNGQTIFGRTRDISESGLGIVVPVPIARGQVIQIEFRTGEFGSKIAVDAAVRHQRGFYHGIEFANLSPADIQAIEAACIGPEITDVRKSPL